MMLLRTKVWILSIVSHDEADVIAHGWSQPPIIRDSTYSIALDEASSYN